MFEKGKSGNPGGRPKGYAEFQATCRKHSPRALKVMLENLGAEDGRLRQAAAEALWDRAWGKPSQALTGEGGEGPVAIEVVSGIVRPGDKD